MKAELLFTSKKYVIFSWQMIGVLIYFAFLSYCYYYIADTGFVLFMGIVFLLPLGLMSLNRFFYIDFYENHIEIKHLLIPFFKQKFNIYELESITHEYRPLAFPGEFAHTGYFSCMVVYFSMSKRRNEKVYWHVSSLYKNYNRIFYENMRKIIDQKQCNCITKNRKYYPKSTYDKRTFTRIIEVPRKTEDSLYERADACLKWLSFTFDCIVSIIEFADYKKRESILKHVFSIHQEWRGEILIRQTIAINVTDNEVKLKITDPYYKCIVYGKPGWERVPFEPLVAEDALESVRREWKELADYIAVCLREDKKLPFEWEKEIDYEANN